MFVGTKLGRPLKPAELAVLRAQYEKEGDMVGVQTKFNYAWVRFFVSPLFDPLSGAAVTFLQQYKGSRKGDD